MAGIIKYLQLCHIRFIFVVMNDKFIDRPGLFGQRHSSRDYSLAKNWGKNIFNSSFPASLIAYMYSKNVDPVYIKTDIHGRIDKGYISGEDVFGINPLSDRAYYNFEAGFSSFEKFYSGNREKIDLVMMDMDTNASLIGLEIKLTALPDNTTKNEAEDGYGCEIVVRPPTICFLACSICEAYNDEESKNRLRRILNKVPKIYHWNETSSVVPHYEKIESAVMEVARDIWDRQQPLIVQPIWKMSGNKLADDCLDVFVWSNLAVLHMCYEKEGRRKGEISRFQRALIWVYLMLKDFVDYDTFDYVRIIKEHSYENANDKAFALHGRSSNRLMRSKELTHPRIRKKEIKNIILGGGQNLLSPERRFDAALVNNPDIFD